MSSQIIKETAIVTGSTVVSAVSTPVLVSSTVSMLGFGSGGISAGTWAAGFMSSYGGVVGTGSTCAILQSIGAVGLGTVATGGLALVGGLSILGSYGIYKCMK
jgi:hypothetical protein